MKSRENGYKFSFLIRFIGPISNVLLCVFKKNGDTNHEAIYNFVTMISFDLVFMTQGIIDQTYRAEQEKLFNEMKESLWAPFSFFAFFMIYSTSSPTPSTRAGNILAYPLY